MNVSEQNGYTLDTNVIRYKIGSSVQDKYKLPTKHFLKRVLKEANEGKSIIYIPNEVRRELEVQAYTLSKKEKIK
jgi:hypothetical protein